MITNDYTTVSLKKFKNIHGTFSVILMLTSCVQPFHHHSFSKISKLIIEPRWKAPGTVLQALYRSTRACKKPRLPNTGKDIIVLICINLDITPLWNHHWHQSLTGKKPVRQLVRVPNQLYCHQLAESRGCSWWAKSLHMGTVTITVQNRWVALFRSIWMPVMEKIST